MYTAQNYCLWLCIACVCVCVDGLHREESLLYSDRVRPLEWNAWWDSVMSSKSLNKHGWFQLVLCVCVCVWPSALTVLCSLKLFIEALMNVFPSQIFRLLLALFSTRSLLPTPQLYISLSQKPEVASSHYLQVLSRNSFQLNLNSNAKLGQSSFLYNLSSKFEFLSDFF